VREELNQTEVQKLLGRGLDLSNEDVHPLLERRSLIVTGAGGRIGSALVLQLIALRPKTSVV
jgi:FlaA1/EpsC-like NDP-sugar epimerase